MSAALRRIGVRAVFLDAGGVLVLPRRELVAAALNSLGIAIDPGKVPAAHYRAVRRLDLDPSLRARPEGYPRALCATLGVPPRLVPRAAAAVARLDDRHASGEVLWSEAAPAAVRVMTRLRAAGAAVVVLTNSDGHAAENLCDIGICQVGPGAGAEVTAVVDSALVGVAKPDPAIFRIALERVALDASAVVHVGDMVSSDLAGARAAGIAAIHLDPRRACRVRDHRHVTSIAGIWRHVRMSDRAAP